MNDPKIDPDGSKHPVLPVEMFETRVDLPGWFRYNLTRPIVAE